MPAEGAMQTEVEAPVTEPLSFRNVTRRYPRVTALEGIDLAVRQDELMAVVGPSGCGKSTLLELVAGLQEPDAGTVTLLGATDAAARRRAEPLFERFGLAEFESARPAELSGGMRQRVAFLRTLLPGRPVLLLDDRIAVLSPRPGRVVAEIPVELPRPRDVTSPEFGELKRSVLEALGL